MSVAGDSGPAVEPQEGRLWEAFARGVRHNVVAEIGVQVLRLGGLVLLARALAPAQFGVFRILLAIAGFATLTNEAGIPDALIQRKELQPEHWTTGWWLSSLLGLGIAAGLYWSAPWIARAMAMPQLRRDTQLLCLPVFLEATVAVGNAQLRRRLQFGLLAAADVVAEVGFLAAALGSLAAGFSDLTLTCGLAVRLAVHAITVGWAAGYLPRGLPAIWAARDIGRFSLSVLGGRVVLAASSNADYVLIGRLLGEAALGAYGMAWDLLRFIPDRLYRVAVRVTLPTFCRLQHRDDKLAAAYRDLIDYCCRIILPMVACAALAAPELLGGIYGRHWISAATPLRLLAPGLALAGLRLAIGTVYYTKDHPAFDFWLHGTRLILIIVTVTMTAPLGLAGVSAGMSGVEGAISLLGQYLVCVLVGLEFSRLIAAAMPAVRLTAGCVLAAAAGKALAHWLDLSNLAALGLIALPAVVVFILAERATARWMLGMALRPSGFGMVANLSEGDE